MSRVARISWFVGLALLAQSAGAQSTSSLAAWTAIMLSPAGALPPAPFIVDTGAGSRSTQIALRTAQWQADSTDAPHNVFGLAVSHRLSSSGATGSAVLGYVRVACSFCKHWVFGGVGAKTPMRSLSLTQLGSRDVSVGVALRGTAGGGFTAGDQWGSALSAAVAGLMDARVPFFWSGWLDLSLTPAVGIGRLSTDDLKGGGAHPMVGANVAWVSSFGLGLVAGVQQVQGGQSEPGASILWQLR